MQNLELDCNECGRKIVLDACQQKEILGQFAHPTQSKIIECACSHFQFILAARRRMPKLLTSWD